MDINALLMDNGDNVITCVTEVPKGHQAVYKKGGELLTVTALEDIPYCHKIALEDIPEGKEVVKYGEMIGRATAPIRRGAWVSHENLRSVPRDYDQEII